MIKITTAPLGSKTVILVESLVASKMLSFKFYLHSQYINGVQT